MINSVSKKLLIVFFVLLYFFVFSWKSVVTMNIKKQIPISLFVRSRSIYITYKRFLSNVKNTRYITYSHPKYVQNLIYTKEDDIYKIVELKEHNSNENDKIEKKKKSVYDIKKKKTQRTEVENKFTNVKEDTEPKETTQVGTITQVGKITQIGENIETNDNEDIEENINSFTEADEDMQLFRNKIKVSSYWLKKLENLKNINAINCVDYLKDDNYLYFDNFKNKGLLKFLNDEKKKYKNYIILARVGDFYETYGLDSIFLIEFLNIKKMNNKLSCGFIKSSINKALHILTKNNLNICIYEELNEKSMKMKKRYLSQIVTPEFPLYINNIHYYAGSEDGTSNYEKTVQENRKKEMEPTGIESIAELGTESEREEHGKGTTSSSLSLSSSCSSFFNSLDVDEQLDIKEIVCIFIESKNIFSLSKINLSLKTIAIYDNITLDVLHIYLKSTPFLKVYIHQHDNNTFTKKITQLVKIENYYLFNNFEKSFDFHMFILAKLKKQMNMQGRFRLIRNKSVFKINPKSNKVYEKIDNDIVNINNTNNINNINEKDEDDNYHDNEHQYYSYCTPLNIFTSYNIGIYKQNSYYENRNNFLLYNIIDVSNSDSQSVNTTESLEFFKNLFLFYPPFEITKHIRFINSFISKNSHSLIIPNVKPFRNNIVITLLSNLKADYNIFKKIYFNIEAVLNCMQNFHYSLLTSMFHILNHQNSFKLNIVKFYELLRNIKNILQTSLQFSPTPFYHNPIDSRFVSLIEFIKYHELPMHNTVHEDMLTEENKQVKKYRAELMQAVISSYSKYAECTEVTEGVKYEQKETGNKKENKENGENIDNKENEQNEEKEKSENIYNMEQLNKALKIDIINDVIGIKKKKKTNEQIEKQFHFYHPVNKKAEIMKNVYVTEHVQKKVKLYLQAVETKQNQINEIIKKINLQLSSSVHILSFVSNFLQIIQALYNHTLNSLKRNWSLPICKHLSVTYANKDFETLEEKYLHIQRTLYSQPAEGEYNADSIQEKDSGRENEELFQNDSNDKTTFLQLTEEEEKKISENVDEEYVEEIKKIYKEKNYQNGSLTYILGLKPYNINKENVVKYDVFFKKKNFMLLTGKNMSGKTTLSFTILCILFLSNLGLYAPCDKNSIIGKFREFYSLKNVNYQEQIENMSLFREQTYYLNSIIEEIKENENFESTVTGEVFDSYKKQRGLNYTETGESKGELGDGNFSLQKELPKNTKKNKIETEKNKIETEKDKTETEKNKTGTKKNKTETVGRSEEKEKEREVFILFDEPCIATTPVDNAIIISAVATYLKNYCGIIITHNYDMLNKLCQSENIIFKKVRDNIHYLKKQEDQVVTTLENGICKNSDALETCKHTNTNEEVLQLLQMYEQKYKFIHNLNNMLYYKFLNYLRTQKKEHCLHVFFEKFLNETNEKQKQKHKQKHITIKEKDTFHNYIELDEIKNSPHLIKESNLKHLTKNDIVKIILTQEEKKIPIKIKQTQTNNTKVFGINKEEKGSNGNCNINGNVQSKQINEGHLHESELNIIIQKIENSINKKILKINSNEEIPLYFKNKSIVYILCIFEKHTTQPYMYIGISDNISERIKTHTRNLRNNKSLLKKRKKNDILDYTYDVDTFYTLLFSVENKHTASILEKQITDLLNKEYSIVSKDF